MTIGVPYFSRVRRATSSTCLGSEENIAIGPIGFHRKNQGKTHRKMVVSWDLQMIYDS
jgi:hypothetical protein